MAIMVLLLSIAFTSFTTFSSHWRKSHDQYAMSLESYKGFRFLTSTVSAVLPYAVRDEKNTIGFYFLGRTDGFTGVSANGVYHAGQLVVFRVLKERQPDGLFSLYYEEAALEQRPLIEAEQVLQFDFRLQVGKDFHHLEFAYYGWRSRSAYEDYISERNAIADKQWLSAFDGMQLKMQPERLEIRMDGFSWLFAVPDARSQYMMKSQAGDDV